MKQTVLELDYQPSGGAVEIVVVQADESPCGAFVSGHFVPLLRTVEGWAFVHNLDVLEMIEPERWVRGELAGVPARGKISAR